MSQAPWFPVGSHFLRVFLFCPSPRCHRFILFTWCSYLHKVKVNAFLTVRPLCVPCIRMFNPPVFGCCEWTRSLLPLLLSHTPKHFLLALSSLCPPPRVSVRQLCSVGRASESDLTSAAFAAQLTCVCLTLCASGCESYVKYGAITFHPSCAARLVCVCVWPYHNLIGFTAANITFSAKAEFLQVALKNQGV